MSELLVLALKFAFLALLWVFILFTATVIRSDLFGRRVPAPSVEAAPAASGPPRQGWSARRAAKRVPTTLRITKGNQAGLTMALGQSLKIGRSTDCQLILDDDYVSTRHAHIFAAESGYLVEDLGSTNGTYVNGQRITAPTTITLSDIVRIGKTILKLEP